MSLEMFKAMIEIDRHLHREVEWWHGEGHPLGSIALILRQVADKIDPPKQPSWGDHWNTVAATLPRPGLR